MAGLETGQEAGGDAEAGVQEQALCGRLQIAQVRVKRLCGGGGRGGRLRRDSPGLLSSDSQGHLQPQGYVSSTGILSHITDPNRQILRDSTESDS